MNPIPKSEAGIGTKPHKYIAENGLERQKKDTTALMAPLAPTAESKLLLFQYDGKFLGVTYGSTTKHVDETAAEKRKNVRAPIARST